MDELLRQAKRLVMTAENATKSRKEIKTATRRVIRLPSNVEPDEINIFWRYKGDPIDMFRPYPQTDDMPSKLANLSVRARLWVSDLAYIAEPYQIVGDDGTAVCVIYGDTRKRFWTTVTKQEFFKWRSRKFRYRSSPGRFMYKSLARTIVKVTDVKIHRLHEMTFGDAQAEGLIDITPDWWTKPWFDLWDSINKSRGFGFDTNPWVYAYEYELVKKLR